MLYGRQKDKSINELYDTIKERLPDGLSKIARALTLIATFPLIMDRFPSILNSFKEFKEALDNPDSEALEKAFLGLYFTIHNTGAQYSETEKRFLRSTGGYLCYPGGLSPLLIACDFITDDTVFADLGAGNGLQGLLLQQLYPHKKTIQIEISQEMVRIGRIYQDALGIKKDKIKWINDDILNAPFEKADLIYIYRPARPVEGESLYRGIAERLSNLKKEVTLFSVADCLSLFLDKSFKKHYDDGHLKIFIKH